MCLFGNLLKKGEAIQKNKNEAIRYIEKGIRKGGIDIIEIEKRLSNDIIFYIFLYNIVWFLLFTYFLFIAF